MESKTILAFLFMLFNLAIFGQSDPASATTLNFPLYNSDLAINSNISTATPSGIANCSGDQGDDDVFFRFVAESNGVKVVANSADFDLVIEIWDEINNQSMACANNTLAGGEEYLINNNLTPGQEYFVRIHSADGISGAGNFSFTYSHLPYWALQNAYDTTSPDGDGYRLFEQVRRDNIASVTSNITQTIWHITRVSDNVTETYTVNGSNYVIVLNTVEQSVASVAIPFFCFGELYDVQIELFVEGVSCGLGPIENIEMRPEPATVFTAISAGDVLDPNSDEINAQNTHYDQIMEWEFSEFGNVVSTVTTNQGQRKIFLYQVPGIVFNRAYEVRVRVTSCGTTGSWSAPLLFITSDMPYTNIIGSDCGINVENVANLQCDLLTSASSYIWQFAPINFNDPTFTPIGPAILHESPNQFVTFSQMTTPLAPGTVYRVAVKPVFWNGTQVGEYGNFCQIGTAGSQVAITEEENTNETINIVDLLNFNFQEVTLISGSKTSLSHQAEEINGNNPQKSSNQLENTFMYSVYSLSGNEVFKKEMTSYELEHLNTSKLNLSSGIYVHFIETNESIYSSKLFIE